MLAKIISNVWAKIKKFVKQTGSILWIIFASLVYVVGIIVMFITAGDSILMRILLCLMCFGIGILVGLLWEVFHD